MTFGVDTESGSLSAGSDKRTRGVNEFATSASSGLTTESVLGGGSGYLNDEGRRH